MHRVKYVNGKWKRASTQRHQTLQGIVYTYNSNRPSEVSSDRSQLKQRAKHGINEVIPGSRPKFIPNLFSRTFHRRYQSAAMHSIASSSIYSLTSMRNALLNDKRHQNIQPTQNALRSKTVIANIKACTYIAILPRYMQNR